ncbi:hypothetical protein ACFL1E_03560 [Candidatus Omnitrophota bacterium]
MAKESGNVNIAFGWIWLLIGIIEAAWMGMHAFKPEWLGGYASLTRRFLRLSHIATMALAMVNIIYGLCLPLTHLSRVPKLMGSHAMIAAAVTMPLLCLLCVYRPGFQSLFFLPVVFFLTAVVIMVIGQLRKGV